MSVKRLFDLFPYQLEKYPQPDALTGKYNGKWEQFSTEKVIEINTRIALGLLEKGYKKGDMIAVMANNCPEWIFADQGIQLMGGIVVPIYPTCSENDIEYIFNHAEIKLVFTENDELTKKIQGLKNKLPALREVFCFEQTDAAPHYEELCTDISEAGKNILAGIQDSILEEDLATIIYTSGTTGNPKGVMLSHKNILSNVLCSEDRLPVGSDCKSLSFLPLSHIFERMLVYMYFYVGISVYFAESIDTIGDNLKEIKPDVFTAVPRLLEKVFDRIIAGGNANGFIKRYFFNKGVKLALQWEPDGKNGPKYEKKLAKSDKMVFSKIREKAGLVNVKAVASGSAALQPRLARFFNGIGVPVVEGYGLTESSPVISVNGFEPGMHKIGTVGTVIKNGEIKIAEDGEILYRGPNVMLGYYKNEDATRDTVDTEGWLHTGDIGELDKEGFLKITDRKKEIFKTSGGKYIAPQVLENKLKESPYIEQICVIGEYQKFPGALIAPNCESVAAKLNAEGEKLDASNTEAILKNARVKALIQAEVDRLNNGFARFEQIKQFELIPEMTIETGELTPSMKVKRRVVNDKYAHLIKKIYDL